MKPPHFTAVNWGASAAVGGRGVAVFLLLPRFLSCLVIFDQFVPHRVQHSERGREGQSEKPGEIPHVLVLSLVSVTALVVDRSFINLAPQHAVDPTRVDDDQRDEDRRDHQHDEEGQMAR